MGLADTVEQALGSRRSDVARPAPNPRAILSQELENERTLLSTAAPDRRALHEGNIQALQRELGGQNGGVGGTSGTGAENKPIMGAQPAAQPSSAPGGLAATVEAALSGSVVPDANVSRGTSATAPKKEMTIGERIVEGPKSAAEFIANQASGLASTIYGGIEGLYQGAKTLRAGGSLEAATNAGASAIENRSRESTYQPSPGTPAAAMVGAMQSPYNPLNYPGQVGTKLGDIALQATGSPALAAGYSTSAALAPFALGAAGARGAPSGAVPLSRVGQPPPANVVPIRPASAGAAAADVATQAAAMASKASPELQAVVKRAGSKVELPTLQRHIEADTLPVPIKLTTGQATQDVGLLSREQNLRGKEAALRDRFAEQNKQLIENTTAIREAAAPDIFVSTKPEIGNIIIDAYNTKDAALNKGISAKYKALEDANGGQFPLNAKQFVDTADAALHKQLLYDHVPAELRRTMDRFKAGSNGVGGGMTFENFESLRTNLARIQRSPTADGNVKAAAATIRESLEALPMPPGAEHLKPLADAARASAKERFELIRKDPAYKAVVEGKASADRFIDRHIVSADLKNVQTMKDNLAGDPVAQQAMSAGAMDHLRDSAGVNSGNFSQAGYNKGVERLRAKLPVIFPMENARQVQQLGDVARYTQAQPRGSFVNNSNTLTAAMGSTAASTAEGVANVAAHGVPVGTWARKGIEGLIKDKSVQRSLQEGGGIRLRDIK